MRTKLNPPKYFQLLLKWFCHTDFYEELAGDLEETFIYNYNSKGEKYARQQYRKEVIWLIRPSVIKEIRPNISHQFSFEMFRNYFKITLRNLVKNKVSSLINILGLAIGLSCTLFILLFVHHETNVDQAFAQKDRIYRITNDERPFNEAGRFLATVSPPFAPTLADEFSEVENAVRLRKIDGTIFKYQDQQFYEYDAFYVDKDFFKLFDFEFKQGDPLTALAEPNTIVLTPSIAEKYFGDKNAVGETIIMADETPLKVTGILKENPTRTHLDFDFLMSFETFKVPFGYPVTLESWGWISFPTFVMLKAGVNVNEFEKRMSEFAEKHIYIDRPVRSKFGLQALTDIYFHSNDLMNAGEFKRGNQSYTYGLLVIAFLILLVAGFNFMNMSTAQSIKRAKEVGVRKVLGAQPSGLITQFITEALLVSTSSLIIGVIFFEFIRNAMFQFLQIHFDFNYTDYKILLPLLFGLTIIVGILSALYPALVLSSFKPLQVLRGMITTNKHALNIRKGLVILQFSITVGLITCSLIVTKQMDFIRNKKLGYDHEQLVSLEMQTDNFLQKFDVAKKILAQNPNVVNITAGDVMNGDYGSVPMTPAVAETGIAMNMMGAYFDYFSTLGIEFIEGRDFSYQHPIDTSTGIIINESAVKTFGWKEPIGQKLQVNSNINGEIVGVVKDFHFYSLHEAITPMVAVVPRTHMSNIILRIRPADDLSQVVQSLENDWKQIAPELPFQFAFFDDNLNQMYESDTQFSKLIHFFSWLAIFIAGLGLYGLIAIISTYKVKEIGIRKVLGASVLNISIFLSKNFLFLILIANLIALPLAWWSMKYWLQGFTYHTEIPLSLFFIATLISLTLGIASLMFQVLKSALANPIKALRNE